MRRLSSFARRAREKAHFIRAILGICPTGTLSGHRNTFPGLHGPDDFHWKVRSARNCMNQNGGIDHNSQHSAQDCEPAGLPDLATETAQVRDSIADYLVDLYSLGVRGYRIDAVQHIDRPMWRPFWPR